LWRIHPCNRFIGAKEAYAAVASNSETIKVVELKSLSATRVEGHSDSVLSLDVSADGAYIVSGSKDNSVRFWGVAGRHCHVAALGLGVGHAEAVGAVRISPYMNACMHIFQSDILACM